MLEVLNQLDTRLFLFLNQINSYCWDNVMVWLSGKLSWLPLYLSIIGYIIWRHKKKSVWIVLSLFVLLALSDSGSVHLFKNVFQRLRPCHNPEIMEYVHTVKKCGGQFGFVSSHASNVFALAGFLFFLFRNKYISIFIIAWASIVSYSRIYLGVHYPGDILCGAIFGFGLGFLMYYGLNKILNIHR